MSSDRVRILLAKIGLDDHQRSLLVLSKGFRDAGFEVINLGTFQTPEMVVKSAISEDVNAIGLSFHTITYLGWVVDVVDLLRKMEVDDISVFVGGTIPEVDDEELRRLGVKGIYRPGSLMETMVREIREVVLGSQG
jgi:methylmalonyl-CoA mutase C-terminal domain/subunit